jgi:ArsR family transcriptional regulator, arsenate/arsenite/antimonite-responsive transcriptional repressor
VNTSTTLEQTSLDKRAALFQALSDPARLEILDMLSPEVCCNCHFQEQLDLAPNLLSYHLRVLREAGLIEGTKRGRWVNYALTPAARELLGAALPVGLQ